jgi:hypothetical protein
MSNLFSPNKFLSEMNDSRGPAKNSLYDVKIFQPPIWSYELSKIPFDKNSRVVGTFEPLTYLCESAEMPGKSFVTEKVKIYGPGYNVPYLTTYQNISLTFLCTNAHTEREIFDLWMNSIINPNTNNVRFPNGHNSSYMTPIHITQYDSQEKEIYKVQLIDAFPASIVPQQLAWSDDGFQRLNVSFLYQKYELGILN